MTASATDGRLYLVTDRAELQRRRQRAGAALIELWPDLYTPDLVWLGDEASRREAYARPTLAGTPPEGLWWVGETSKTLLDGAGRGPLPWLITVPEARVPVYYGPRVTDVESLPLEESLRARVLSAHGIAVLWATLGPSGARTEHQPAHPADPVFYLRRPHGTVAHVWRLFRTRAEAVDHVAAHLPGDAEAARWAAAIPAERFEDLVLPAGEAR